MEKWYPKKLKRQKRLTAKEEYKQLPNSARTKELIISQRHAKYGYLV